MTINLAVDLADKRLGNLIPAQEKVMWLRNLDIMLKKTVFDMHEGFAVQDEIAYSVDDMDKVLLVPSPYDELYVKYLVMKMHLYNGEINLYNNAAQSFNAELYNFKNYWHTTHKPKALPKLKGW